MQNDKIQLRILHMDQNLWLEDAGHTITQSNNSLYNISIVDCTTIAALTLGKKQFYCPN